MQVFTCGAAGCRQLLDGSSDDRSTPMLVPNLLVQLIEVGGTFTLAQTEANLLYYGEHSSIPVSLGVFPITQIACGWSHALLLGEGQVWTYGEGRHGQLGLGDITQVQVPTALELSERVKFVACGFRASFAVTVDQGQVYCFGDNKKSQLCQGPYSNISIPTLHSTLRNVRGLASGHRHTAAIVLHQLYVWGQNTHGQFGQPQPSASQEPLAIPLPNLSIREVKCGWFHTLLLTNTGDLYIAGKGDFGQQGTGDFLNRANFHLLLANVDTFASGSEHILALCSGQAYAWGWNEHGNLGLGDSLNRPLPSCVSLPNLKAVAAAAAISYFCT